MLYKKKLRLIDANILYLLGAILFLTIGFYLQSLNLELGLILTQFSIIFMPPFVYLLIKGLPIKSTMRLNKLSIKHSLMIVCITLLMYPIAAMANALFLFILSLLGNLNVPELPTATNTSQYILLLVIISLSAGICEEVFFRGFILRGYQKLGRAKSVIISSILFGIFHFNIYNLLGPIILGIIFGYLVLLTDSLYAGIIGHIVNNGFAVTLGFLINISNDLLQNSHEAVVDLPTSRVLLQGMLSLAVIGIITGIIAFKLIKIIKMDLKKENNFLDWNKIYEIGQKYEKEKDNKISVVEFLPVLPVLIFYIVVAFMQINEIISLG
mgnify:CR=1 FL=1